MKTYSIAVSILGTILLATSASAMSGTSLQQGSLFSGDSDKAHESLFDGGPRFLSVGAYLANQKRGMESDEWPVSEWTINHTIAYIGVDLTPWLTILGGGGVSDLSTAGESRDSEFEWMGAIQWRILNYLALDPLFNDSAYQVSLDSEFRGIGSSSEYNGDDLTWLELFGSLTMSFTVNMERGDLIDSLSVFFGPAYSAITATSDNALDVDLTEDQALGFLAGMQINPSENVTLRMEIQKFDASTFGGSLTFHF